MNLKRQILGTGILLLGSCGAFGKEAEQKPKVVDLNQIDLEQVDDNWDNQPKKPQVNPDRGIKIRDIVEPTSEYTYASFGKPDPFVMPAFDTNKGNEGDQNPLNLAAGTVKEISISSPLQGYPISDLKIKGVWQLANAEMRAVVLTPKNEGIVIKTGDPISSGKVLQIEKEAIVVRLYRLRKDGIREYDDSRISFGLGSKAIRGTIKLEPGKAAQFPDVEIPAAATAPNPFKPSAPSPADVANAREGTQGGVWLATPGTHAAVTPPPAPTPAGGAAPVPAAAPAAGWPLNMAPPAKDPAPSSGRPGAQIN